MAVITANVPLVLTVPAGFRLQFGTPISGVCVVTLPGRILTEDLTDGEGLGPYQSDASVSITSTVNSTCWTIRRDGPTAVLQAAHLPQAPFLSGVSVMIGESAAGSAYPAVWTGSSYSAALQSLVSGGGSTTAVASSRSALAADTGATLELANGITYTLDSAVPLAGGVTLIGPATGSATLAVTGSATMNGGTTSITISAGQVYSAIPRASSASAYIVKGS